jgi:hypothetical protein
MEVAGSALTGALRVGLQVVSTARRPIIEIYQQVRNVIHPEVEYRLPTGAGGPDSTFKDRRQEVMITLTAVNMGAVRAENVTFRIQPGLTKNFGPEFGKLFQTTLPSFAPGQAMFLINFNQFDLLTYEDDGPNAKRPSGAKTEALPILIEYDGPWSGLNRLMRLLSHLRKRRQYAYLYRFNPLSVMTDLPPPETL